MTVAPPADAAPTTPAGPARRPRSATSGALTPAATLNLGVCVLWLSLIVLLPIAAVLFDSVSDGWGAFWAAVTDPLARSAITLTVGSALLVTVINAVMGTLIAWILVRDSFPGRRLVEVVIDIPFALPTIVAGLILVSLYGPGGPFGVNLVGTKGGVVLAMLFVTLPFVVRSVQPVLIEMDVDVEEAAASLGASGFTTFRRIVLPTILPAVLAGSALAFARALGEYGSIILISANIQGETEVASARMLALLESGDQAGAAAVASILLVVAIVVLLLMDLLRRWAGRRG
ncbi:sulfate ABC transporter permease subunit CysT [Spongisporangium articulatum]|uniref:Sulfate transport system permease protein CysT n=1 Tax=Spongisporangium articulatum TaxID=3362603 RepID=A0ABW8AHX6_9ACTN